MYIYLLFGILFLHRHIVAKISIDVKDSEYVTRETMFNNEINHANTKNIIPVH